MTDNATTPEARLLGCGFCYEEHGEEVHPHPECPIVTVARYQRRADTVQAVQWTGSNEAELRAFAGHDFATIDPEDRVEDGEKDAQVLVQASYWTPIGPGWWVLKLADHFDVERDEAFRAQWAPAPVSSAVPDHTLRDRVAAVLAEADGWKWAPGFKATSPTWHGYQERAAAVVSVLPPPADRATVLRAAADAVFALDYDVMVGEVGDENFGSMREAWDVGTIHATELLRRLAAEAQPEPEAAAAPLCDCPGEDALEHQFGVEGCTCIPFTRKHGKPRYCQPGDTVEDISGWERGADCLHHRTAAGVRQPDTETPTDEDPARIDRLRPEFFECASVEAIDAQIQRAQRQQRNWGSRVQKLTGLRQTRVAQKEAGVWPDAAVSGRPAADDSGEETP